MQITEITIEVGCDSLLVKPAGEDFPNQYTLTDAGGNEPLYLTLDAAKEIVRAIEAIQTGVLTH